jgi:hypothetical protein
MASNHTKPMQFVTPLGRVITTHTAEEAARVQAWLDWLKQGGAKLRPQPLLPRRQVCGHVHHGTRGTIHCNIELVDGRCYYHGRRGDG